VADRKGRRAEAWGVVVETVEGEAGWGRPLACGNRNSSGRGGMEEQGDDGGDKGAKGRTTEWRQRGQVAAWTGERNAKKAAGIATRADGVQQWREGMQAGGEGWKTHIYITV
jgi:hypothetical protein